MPIPSGNSHQEVAMAEDSPLIPSLNASLTNTIPCILPVSLPLVFIHHICPCHGWSSITLSINTLPVIFCLPYHKPFEPIMLLLRLFDVRLVFYESTVKKMLIRNSPSNDNSIVYRISCKTCSSFYLRQTGKDLRSRVSQST